MISGFSGTPGQPLNQSPVLAPQVRTRCIWARRQGICCATPTRTLHSIVPSQLDLNGLVARALWDAHVQCRPPRCKAQAAKPQTRNNNLFCEIATGAFHKEKHSERAPPPPPFGRGSLDKTILFLKSPRTGLRSGRNRGDRQSGGYFWRVSTGWRAVGGGQKRFAHRDPKKGAGTPPCFEARGGGTCIVNVVVGQLQRVHCIRLRNGRQCSGKTLCAEVVVLQVDDGEILLLLHMTCPGVRGLRGPIPAIAQPHLGGQPHEKPQPATNPTQGDPLST